VPLGVVFVLVDFGTTSDHLTAFLKKHMALTKAATALFFLAVAVLLVAITR
jgi:hypothetical protein